MTCAFVYRTDGILGDSIQIEKTKNGGILLVGHGCCCCGRVVNTMLTDFFFLDMQLFSSSDASSWCSVLSSHLCTNILTTLVSCSDAVPVLLQGCSELMNWM